MECLKEYVGVTLSDCECIIAGLSTEEIADLRKSTSGFFLDNIPAALTFKALNKIEACKDFYKLSIEARDNAINDFNDNLTTAISRRFDKAVKNYNGFLAKASYAQSLNNIRQFQGLQIIGNERTDAEMLISRIRIVGNASGDMVLKIVRSRYEENDFELIHELPFSAIANNFTTVALPSGGIKLPLGENLYPYEYRMFYDKGGLPNFLPKDNLLGCGCKGSDADLLDTYVKVRGISFVDSSQMQNYTTDAYAHGITVDMSLTCKTEVLICREVANDETIQMAAKWAIAYRANYHLIEKVLGSPEINRFTMMNREYLWGKRNHFEKEYNNRIEFIAGKVDVSTSDCFKCGKNQMWMGKIK